MSLRDRWTAQAQAWAEWAAAGHEDDVLPHFFELLPNTPGRALDVGCGEGRLSRALRERAFEVVGIDVAPRLIEFARQHDPDGDYRIGAAEELPFGDGSFDVVVAFNVLMNVDDPAAAVGECARVLRSHGAFCISLVHPVASAGAWRDDAFVISDYTTERPHEERLGELVFANVHRPLEAWSRFLEDAGFVVEALREPPRENMARWERLPMFLFVRAVKA